MNFFKSAIFSFFFNNVFKAKMFTNEIEDVREAPSGGGRYPCAPLEMHPPRPPQEREAGSNLSNSKLKYSDFLLFLSIGNVTI